MKDWYLSLLCGALFLFLGVLYVINASLEFALEIKERPEQRKEEISE